MQAIIVIILCLAAAAYVIHSARKDRRVVRDHNTVTAALAPGPRIREMTIARPNPVSPRRLANGSRPVFKPAVFSPADPDDFKHVDTDYGTYTPADVDMAVMARANIELHHSIPVCAEAHAYTETHLSSPACAEDPSRDTFSGGHHDTSYGDSSYGGGFDGGGHHGH